MEGRREQTYRMVIAVVVVVVVIVSVFDVLIDDNDDDNLDTIFSRIPSFSGYDNVHVT
jgi:hypothetical protein